MLRKLCINSVVGGNGLELKVIYVSKMHKRNWRFEDEMVKGKLSGFVLRKIGIII